MRSPTTINGVNGSLLRAKLSERFKVNRHTVRRSIDELVHMGLVERHQGRGTLIVQESLSYPLSTGTRFTENLQSQGFHDDTHLLNSQIIEAGTAIARYLKLEHRARVVHIELLRMANGRPVCLGSAYFPYPRFAELAVHYQGGSLHDCLDKNFDVRPRRIMSLVRALLPQQTDADLLHQPRRHPILQVRSVNVDPKTETPIEYVETRFRGDSVQLEVIW